jgi:glutathione synthase/RimK-type ligase-like ATP-grasp enzyme
MGKKLITTNLIIQACKELEINFSFATKNKTIITLSKPNGDHFIINSNFGLTNSTEAHLCLDKAYQYELLNKVISMPQTLSYTDPLSKFGKFSKFKSHQGIIKHIEQQLDFPLIVKKNTGTEGENVFSCQNKDKLTKAVKTIFNLNHHLYDHVLLAQLKIEIKNEYRAIFYKQKLEILYKKDNNQAKFIGNLSPLHFERSQAVDLTNQKLINKITKFITPIFKKINLTYAGFDIIEDNNNKLWLIEINSIPGYAHYLENNPKEKVLKLFKKIILDLKK